MADKIKSLIKSLSRCGGYKEFDKVLTKFLNQCLNSKTIIKKPDQKDLDDIYEKTLSEPYERRMELFNDSEVNIIVLCVDNIRNCHRQKANDLKDLLIYRLFLMLYVINVRFHLLSSGRTEYFASLLNPDDNDQSSKADYSLGGKNSSLRRGKRIDGNPFWGSGRVQPFKN